MPKLAEKIVRDAIRNLSEKHPNVLLSKGAFRAVIARGRRYEGRMLSDLRQGRVTQGELREGLEEVLADALRHKKEHWVGRIWAEAPQRAAGSITGRHPATIGWHQRAELSVRDVQIAMKKKCKTFPWC